MAINYFPYKEWRIWDFPGSPVVKTLTSSAGVVGSIPHWGAEIPHAAQPKHETEAIL